MMAVSVLVDSRGCDGVDRPGCQWMPGFEISRGNPGVTRESRVTPELRKTAKIGPEFSVFWLITLGGLNASGLLR